MTDLKPGLYAGCLAAVFLYTEMLHIYIKLTGGWLRQDTYEWYQSSCPALVKKTNTCFSQNGFTKLHVRIHDSDWYKETFPKETEREFITKKSWWKIIFSPSKCHTFYWCHFSPIFFFRRHWMCEWASHLPQQYYSVQLTGHFPQHKKQRPVCFYGFSHTGDLSGILHRRG